MAKQLNAVPEHEMIERANTRTLVEAERLPPKMDRVTHLAKEDLSCDLVLWVFAGPMPKYTSFTQV